MPRKFFRKYLPAADRISSHQMLALFGHRLRHPSLWHLNRKSVSGAVAIGLFAGLVPGPFQMLAALLLAIPLRKNLPVALLVTVYTNPLTIVPLYLLAYQYGKLILGHHDSSADIAPFDFDWAHLLDSTAALLDWTLALGKPLAAGLPALALTLAALGYCAVDLGWRVHVQLAWRARRKKRLQKRRAQAGIRMDSDR